MSKMQKQIAKVWHELKETIKKRKTKLIPKQICRSKARHTCWSI